ncbi:MAG: hypothetical protein ACLUUO_17915 [Sellimonas intestinalis]
METGNRCGCHQQCESVQKYSKLRVSYQGTHPVGEAVIRYNDFEKINEEIEDVDFAK